MRPLSSAQQKVYAAKGYRTLARARVSNDGGSTWVDLRTLRGRDFFLGATWSETVDQGLGECTVIVKREVDGWSLSPDMASSPINLESGTDFPFLQKGYTQLQVQTVVAPLDGVAPSSGDWVNVFHGVLCGVSTGGGGMLELFCRDLGEYLMRTFIEREREYGSEMGVALLTVLNDIISDNYAAIPRWKAATSYAIGDVVLPTPGPGRTGRSYIVSSITTGTSGGTEPTWPSPTGSVVDGGVTWTVNGLIPGTPPTVIGDPDWDLGRFLQKGDPLFLALETLAMQIGWALRYRWDENSGDPPGVSRYTLYSPDRDSLSSVYTLTEYQVRASPLFRSNTDDIRNAVEVPFLDRGDLDPAGNPKPKVALVDSSNNAVAAASEAKHGRRFMRYAPGAAANIDTLVEAERLALAAVLDLADMADCEVDTSFLHFLQLGDAITLPADGVNFSEDQVLSVVALSHKLSDSKATTTLSLRTRPQVANQLWHVRAATSGVGGGTIAMEGPNAVENLEVTETAGGFTLAFTRPLRGRAVKDLELHLATTENFTPDDSTFWAQGDLDSFVVTDLEPGTTYYAQVVPKDMRRNRGAASDEVEFTTRYVEPRTLQPRITYGSLPLNSDFEANNGASAPPDTWEMTAGAWGTEAELTTTAYTGTSAVRMRSDGILSSQMWSAREGDRYSIDVVFRPESTASASGEVMVEWFDETFASIGVGSGTSVIFSGSTGAWHRGTSISTNPSGTRYMRVNINGDQFTASRSVIVDSVLVKQQNSIRASWGRFQHPSLGDGSSDYTNSWVPYGTGAGQYVEAYLDPNTGFVTLRGQVKSGTSGAVALTLFVGYRPVGTTYRLAYANGGVVASIEIQADGDVLITSADTTLVDLGGITFPVF